MTGIDPAYLTALLTTLREYGVTRYKDGSFEVELTLTTTAPKAVPAPVEAEEPEESDTCPCGHDFAEHGSLGCFHGCRAACTATPKP
jgi:hypothetical protein